MATTKQDLDSFTQYARLRLERGDEELSIDELFDLWRTENPSPASRAEDVAAIAAAIEDLTAVDPRVRSVGS